MRRGFKAEAERLSLDARQQLGIAPHAPLDPWAYATHVGVVVLDFRDLDIPPPSVTQLTVKDGDSWSGMTIKEGNTIAIVLNPSHAQTRLRSTLMHELSHIVLKHTPSSVQVSPNGLLLLSDYSDDQEAEADWLSAAMLIPRDALMRLRSKGKSSDEIAAFFEVSGQLCEWRLRTTGVEIQIRRRGR